MVSYELEMKKIYPKHPPGCKIPAVDEPASERDTTGHGNLNCHWTMSSATGLTHSRSV